MTQIGLECFFDSIITWLISSKIIKIENFSSFVLSYSHKLLKRKLMDDMINRHDSIFKNDKKDGPIKNREKRIKEMDEVIKKDLE